MADSTLRQRVSELIEQHGSLRAAALVLETDAGYLSRLQSGEKNEPGEPLLRRMGLRRVVAYERRSGSVKRPAVAPETVKAIQVCQLFIDTIECVENRCMAADGPVTPTCKEITDDELRKVYKACRAALAGAPAVQEGGANHG